MKFKPFLNLLFVVSPFLMVGQGFKDYAANIYLRHANAQEYLGPLIDVISSSSHNSALSHFHPDSNRRFHFYLGLNGSANFITSGMKNFTGVTEDPFQPQKELEVPTVFGNQDEIQLYDENGNSYFFPGGFAIKQINLVFPIIHVGTFFSTNLSGKFLSLNVGNELEKIQIFGFGLNHFISDHWKAENYQVSIGGGFDQYKISDLVKARQYFVQATGGQQIKRFNYYGFIQANKSDYTFYYEDKEEGNGSVQLHGNEILRFGLGAGISLWKFHFQTEASFINPIVANFNIGLKF